MMTLTEIMRDQHRQAVEQTREKLKWLQRECPKEVMTVGKHEAKNLVHIKRVLEEADQTCPRAADTIRWMIWHNALEAVRMSNLAATCDGVNPAPETPSGRDALQAIADMPFSENLEREGGREDAYRAIEALFSEPPHISASERQSSTDSPEKEPYPWTLEDEIDASERRLKQFCNQVNAGEAQGGGREFYRKIAFAFEALRELAGMPEFKMYPDENKEEEMQTQPEADNTEMQYQNGRISWDPEAQAYYVTPENRPSPPFQKQLIVEAVVDVGSDGTLAGFEIFDTRIPAPHVSASETKTVNDILEKRLATALAAKHEDAPFGMDAEEASLWHQAQAVAIQHALEMIGDTIVSLSGHTKSAEFERAKAALKEIAAQDVTEIALDPDWPRRIARNAGAS